MALKHSPECFKIATPATLYSWLCLFSYTGHKFSLLFQYTAWSQNSHLTFTWWFSYFCIEILFDNTLRRSQMIPLSSSTLHF